MQMDPWLRSLGQSDLKCHATPIEFFLALVCAKYREVFAIAHEMLAKKFGVCVQPCSVACLEAASG